MLMATQRNITITHPHFMKIVMITVLLSVFMNACQPQPDFTPTNPTPTIRSATEVIPTPMNHQTRTSTPSLVPTQILLPTSTLTPIITQTSPKAQLKLAFGADVDNSVSTNNDSILNIKEQIYFGGDFGGGGGDCASEPIGTSQPGLIISEFQICFWGFPLNSEIEVEFYTPSKQLASSTLVKFIETIENPTYTDIRVDKREDGTMGIIWYHFPDVGIEPGNWKVILKSEEALAEGTLEVGRPSEPIIRALPSLTIDPFKSPYDLKYYVGDTVIIAGSGFPPNQNSTIGIYLHDPAKNLGNVSVYLADLVKAISVKTDTQGMFWFPFQISDENRSGSYSMISSADNYDGVSVIKSYNLPGFRVSNEKLPENRSREIVEFETIYPCSDDTPSRLKVGDQAFVSYFPADPNTVREKPGRDQKKLGLIQPAEEIEILKGPKCADGWVWWKIRSLETGVDGWTPEGDGKVFWLIPMAAENTP